ncbi:unnamed protein product, partial [Ilex paraguariensis]
TPVAFLSCHVIFYESSFLFKHCTGAQNFTQSVDGSSSSINFPSSVSEPQLQVPNPSQVPSSIEPLSSTTATPLDNNDMPLITDSPPALDPSSSGIHRMTTRTQDDTHKQNPKYALTVHLSMD